VPRKEEGLPPPLLHYIFPLCVSCARLFLNSSATTCSASLLCTPPHFLVSSCEAHMPLWVVRSGSPRPISTFHLLFLPPSRPPPTTPDLPLALPWPPLFPNAWVSLTSPLPSSRPELQTIIFYFILFLIYKFLYIINYIQLIYIDNFYYIYIFESIFIRTGSQASIESRQIYTSLFRLIIELDFVFTNSSFNNQFEHESSLVKPISSKLISSSAHSHPYLYYLTWQR
jgi:hypothetical protein